MSEEVEVVEFMEITLADVLPYLEEILAAQYALLVLLAAGLIYLVFFHGKGRF